MQDFAGKVAVITGAASGIGKALTEKCIAEGMHVVMADIEEAALEKAAAELQATTNNQVLPIVANVAMEAELRKVRDEAVETLGGVHLLFNNAGVGGGGNSWNATQKDWDWVFGVNLWSVIYGLRVFVPQMIAQETPCHIVNTASIAGIIGGSTNALYSVTKHGVVALTENLSVDLKEEDTNIGCSVLRSCQPRRPATADAGRRAAHRHVPGNPAPGHAAGGDCRNRFRCHPSRPSLYPDPRSLRRNDQGSCREHD